MTGALVIADSVSDTGDRLTTVEVTLHRFVLAELNTHRVFSRNSASSRAIPLSKQLTKVSHRPAEPIVWAGEQRGMQGGDEVDDIVGAQITWRMAAEDAVRHASALGTLGVHKSIANRLLEPFLMHTVVITSTSWSNFFKLRLDKMAQPEIRVAAEHIHAAMADSTPQILGEGQWHMPYLLPSEDQEIVAEGFDPRHVSAARCARVSYETHDGVRDFSEDIRLYQTLTSNGHASPLEHVARPAPDNHHLVNPSGYEMSLPLYGNLLGWHQLRFDVEAEREYVAFS